MKRMRTRKGNGYFRKCWENSNGAITEDNINPSTDSFAIVRPLRPNHAPMFRQIFRGVEEGATEIRGETSIQILPSASIIMKAVVRLEAPGKYDTSEVKNLLYEKVPSLREPLKFPIDAIEAFTTKNRGTHLVATSTETINDAFVDEHNQIIDTLAMNLHDLRFYRILPIIRPHVTGVTYPCDISPAALNQKHQQIYQNMQQITGSCKLPTLELSPFEII